MNQQAFETAVADVAQASRKLLDEFMARPEERPSSARLQLRIPDTAGAAPAPWLTA
jgi:hypothetical protein